MDYQNKVPDEIKVPLKDLLIKHEGLRRRIYQDSVGKWTIGIGRNITDRDLGLDEIDLMFKNDTDYLYNELCKRYAYFPFLNDARKIAVVDMSFMGMKTFSEFEKFHDAMDKKDYTKAALECLNSLWAKQVGHRALDISHIIVSGELDLESYTWT